VNNVVKWISLALLMSIAAASETRGATYSAASCAESDVANAVAKATNGDTVIIPSCPASSNVTWTTGLSYSVGITLIGQGAGNTVITDGTSKGDSNCQGTTPLISVNVASNVFLRISGFTINGKAPSFNCGESANHISISGSSHQFRVDGMVFNMFVTAIGVAGDSWGVIDHNTFNEPANAEPFFPVEVHHDSWQGVGNYGDNSWAQPDTLGQAGAVYIETNTFSWPNSAWFPVGCFDTEAGGRLVFRYNTGCPFVGMHGLDSSGRLRSGRQYEIYNNTFTAQPNPNANMYTGVFLRGGTGVIFNNTFNDNGSTPYITLIQVNNFRDTNDVYFPWGQNYGPGGCDGRGPWDTNTGATYVTGKYNGATATTEQMVDSTQNWSTNQWVGYSIVDTTTGWGSVIVSNTSTTITTQAAQQGAAHVWNNGDGYEILRAYPCADQVGRGAGAYISGSNQTPIALLNQASDPLYEWNNTHNGTTQAAIVSNNPQHVAPNRDFYTWTGSFDGATGVGTGTFALRPSTCTPNVAYWATDQNTLYQCSATNTWVAHYTPYTYPHPLTLGQSSGNPPAAPTNLTATIQ